MYEKQSRNTSRSSDTIASFLLKTYEILEHPEYERMISWDKNNVGFIIHDVVSFTKEILPKYFRHSNFSSFVRQLNMYDFHKVKQQNDSLVFKNPMFCKGEQRNLKFIRRKAAKKLNGQKRMQSNQKNEIENQKYENLLKGFKKSLQTEINQSSLFYQKSIQIIKQLNQSNQKKANYLGKLYSTIEKKSFDNTTVQEQVKQQIIQESLNDDYVENKAVIKQQNQIQGHKYNLQPKIQSNSLQYSSTHVNLDNLIILKEQVYKSMGTFENWLIDYIENQKKKLRYINGYRNQLNKCIQNIKNNQINNQINENNGAYEDKENHDYNQEEDYENQERQVGKIKEHLGSSDKTINKNEQIHQNGYHSTSPFENIEKKIKTNEERIILPVLSSKKLVSMDQRLQQQDLKTNLFPNQIKDQHNNSFLKLSQDINSLLRLPEPISFKESFSTFKPIDIEPSFKGFTPLSSFVNKGGFVIPSVSQRSFVVMPVIRDQFLTSQKQVKQSKQKDELLKQQMNENSQLQQSQQSEYQSNDQGQLSPHQSQ